MAQAFASETTQDSHIAVSRGLVLRGAAQTQCCYIIHVETRSLHCDPAYTLRPPPGGLVDPSCSAQTTWSCAPAVCQRCAEYGQEQREQNHKRDREEEGRRKFTSQGVGCIDDESAQDRLVSSTVLVIVR